MKNRGSILVVDDESVIRQLLVRTISRAGYQVSEAADGVEALEYLARSHVDIVISDIKMPRMDGMDLLAEIRRQYPHVSVVLITGHGSEYNAEAVLKAGADYFITKPFKNTEIAPTLAALFHRREVREQAQHG